MAEKKKKPYEIGELDQYLFGQGNHYEIYKKLGAHLVQDGKQKGVYFAVWAPHAQAVSVVGELLAEEKATVQVLKSTDKWYGVTYKEDKPVVVAAIKRMKAEGLYPEYLWEK